MKWFSALKQNHLSLQGRQDLQILRSTLVALSRRYLWRCAMLHSLRAMDTICSNSVLSALDKSDQWLKALSFAGWMTMHQVKTDTCTHNTLASACSVPGSWLGVCALLQTILARKGETDSITWSTLVGSCADSLQWGQACRIFGTVFSQPNDIARSAAVHSCLAWQKALQVAGKLRPLSSSYRAVVNAFMGSCQNSVWELPMAILRQLSHPKPRSFTIAMAGPWGLAADLLGHMKRCAVLPDALTINACSSALERGSAWAASLGLIGNACAVRLCVGSPAILVQTLAASRFGGWQAALFQGQDRRARPSLVVRNAVITACERGFSWRISLFLLSQCITATLEMDSIGRSSVITACSGARRDMFCSKFRVFS